MEFKRYTPNRAASLSGVHIVEAWRGAAQIRLKNSCIFLHIHLIT